MSGLGRYVIKHGQCRETLQAGLLLLECAALLACERAVVLLGLLLLNIASDPDNVKMSERLRSSFSKGASLM